METLNGLTQINTGLIQKGDLVLNNNMGMITLSRVVKTSKINAFVKGVDSASDLAWEVCYDRSIDDQIAKENDFLQEIGRIDRTVKVFRKTE
jgi:hypothetical protein